MSGARFFQRWDVVAWLLTVVGALATLLLILMLVLPTGQGCQPVIGVQLPTTLGVRP